MWVALLLVVAAVSALGQHAPGDGAPWVESGVDLEGHARLFLDGGDLEGVLGYGVRYDADQRLYDDAGIDLYNGITAGAYYRLLRNLKVGAFYRLQIGARHDEDWIDEGSEWVWRDTGDRLEHILMADVTPRFLLDFLPGESWVFQLKSRYELTLYQQDGDTQRLQSLLVRPGLTYFLTRDREPVLNLSLQYATYLSLDFGDRPWYRHGPYLNVLYHVLPGLSIDAGIAYHTVYWTESAAFDAAWPDNRYAEPIYRHWSVDLGVIYRLNL
jgi:hypothetical protein